MQVLIFPFCYVIIVKVDSFNAIKNKICHFALMKLIIRFSTNLSF